MGAGAEVDRGRFSCQPADNNNDEASCGCSTCDAVRPRAQAASHAHTHPHTHAHTHTHTHTLNAAAVADDHDDDASNSLSLLIATGVAALAGAVLHILGVTGVLQYIAIALSLAGVVCGLIIIFPEVRESIRHRSVDINILMVIAILGACLLGDFAEAGAVVFFFCIGEELELRSLRKNRDSIAKLMDLTPQVVHVLEQGSVRDSSPDEVQLGATVVVRPGERIPLDGTVCAGFASVDEAPITGESVPVQKSPGDALYSGALSLDGKLEYTVTATVENSTLARIVHLVEESQSKRTPYERFINRFARYYTPLVVVLAVLVAVVPPLLTLLTPLALGGFATWGYRALALLVISCPCALVIATPVCVVTGLSRAARMGVLVKGGAFLELAAKVKAVAFDKTGTLTCGKPAVTTVTTLPTARGLWGDQAEAYVLAYAAALERDSTHPLACAIVQRSEQGLREVAGSSAGTPNGAIGAVPSDAPPVILAHSITERAGRGITGEADGRNIAVGSPSFAAERADLNADALVVIASIEQDATTALVVLFDDTPIGILGVKDVVRPESAQLLAQLAHQGKRTVMLTGDNLTTATAIAQETGIALVHAGLLPEEKMDYVARLKQEYGVVAMVGDGINDAPALALADVGIALGAASSDTALEVADVALMANNIEELPALFRLARKVVSTIHTNIAFALIVKAAVMVLAILGIAQMWMAIFADVGVLILVILYSMRIGLPARRA